MLPPNGTLFSEREEKLWLVHICSALNCKFVLWSLPVYLCGFTDNRCQKPNDQNNGRCVILPTYADFAKMGQYPNGMENYHS